MDMGKTDGKKHLNGGFSSKKCLINRGYVQILINIFVGELENLLMLQPSCKSGKVEPALCRATV